MKFQVKGSVERLIKTDNQKYWLYTIKETTGERTKSWKIFTKMFLELGGTYTLSGYVTEQPNEKMKVNDKPIWQTVFNAEQIEPSGMDIPF